MNTFALDMKKFADKAGEFADVAVRQVCLNLTTGIVLKTPVDTGRARANWQASIDGPSSGTVSFEGDKGSGAGAPRPSSASERAIAASQAAIKSATGKVFWLSNNLPYIVKLEYGHSKQAPSGMVRKTINEVKRSLSKYGVK